MFGFYISLPFLLFAIYRLIIVLINYFTRPFLSAGIPNENPLVSILVYVRNSENCIGQLVQGLRNQEYQNYEVLIYNDQSTDRTLNVIGEFVGGDKRFRLFNGSDIQNDYQRKNYAYDKLTQLSKGQYYIFIDHDLNVENQFIANTVSHMQKTGLSLLAIYPKRQSKNFWKKVHLSASHWLLFSLVSVKSFLKNRSGDTVILGKPLVIIEFNAYQSGKWYEQFKNEENPEYLILKAINDQNLKTESLLSDNSLTREASDSVLNTTIEGLFRSRNRRIAFAIAVGLSPFLIVFLMPFPLVFLYLFSVIYGNMLAAIICQQSVLINFLLLPVQFFVITQTLVKGILKK